MAGPKVVPTRSPNSVGENNSWAAWGKHVLSEQERQNNVIELIRGEVQKQNIAIATLTVKSGMVGFLGGLVPALIALAIAIVIWLVKK